MEDADELVAGDEEIDGDGEGDDVREIVGRSVILGGEGIARLMDGPGLASDAVRNGPPRTDSWYVGGEEGMGYSCLRVCLAEPDGTKDPQTSLARSTWVGAGEGKGDTGLRLRLLLDERPDAREYSENVRERGERYDL